MDHQSKNLIFNKQIVFTLSKLSLWQIMRRSVENKNRKPFTTCEDNVGCSYSQKSWIVYPFFFSWIGSLFWKNSDPDPWIMDRRSIIIFSDRIVFYYFGSSIHGLGSTKNGSGSRSSPRFYTEVLYYMQQYVVYCLALYSIVGKKPLLWQFFFLRIYM
jgi:hypothetical protein